MADPNTRQGKRTPVTLKIKFKSETLEQFIERYAVDVSQGGIFIRTKEPLAVGTQMKFEFQLRDASPLIAGEGTVVWTRENDPSRPAIAPGMGVRFDRLADGSQSVLERILAEKAKQAPGRGANDAATKPPLFTDTPTKVAPAPVQEALGIGSRRPRTDSEQTPLPPPRPFHSDADDFDEKAFEEATKVRSLEELAAQTAGLAPGPDPASDDAPTNTAVPKPPDDELAARRATGRAESTLSEPPAPSPTTGQEVERESAPGLPEPPPPRASRPRLDSPTPRSLDDSPGARTNIESAKASARAESAAPTAVSAELSHPVAPARSSAASIIIMLLVLVAGGAAAVWWFVLRENVAEQVAQDDGTGSAGSEVAAVGSDGSDTAMQGSDGSAGTAAVMPDAPPAEVVDTVVTASIPKGATVEIVGTDQKGPAPFTAKLEKDKAYRARITAPGFLISEIDVTGGQEKASAKLVAKPHVITVTTDPPGADIYVDNVNTQKITPSEVTLTAAQAAKARVRIVLRRPGYRAAVQMVTARSFKDEDARMIASIATKLAVAQRPTGSGSSTEDGSDSDTTDGNGSGSATTPTGTGTSGTGSSGTGTTGTGTTGGGTSGSGTTGTPGTGTTGSGGGAGGGTTGGGTSGAGSAKPPTSSAPATKPPAETSTAPTSNTATPSASTGEPEPSWTK